MPASARAQSLALTSPERALAQPWEVDVERAFRDHYDFAWRVLVCSGVPRATLDDAIQDVFFTVYRRRNAFDGRAPLRHWIYGIAKGVGRNYGRRTRNQNARLVQLPQLAVSPDQEERLAKQEALELVATFTERLSPEQREVFVLSHIEGMTAPEIADLTEVSVNTVYSRLRLARARFEDLIGGGSDE